MHVSSAGMMVSTFFPTPPIVSSSEFAVEKQEEMERIVLPLLSRTYFPRQRKRGYTQRMRKRQDDSTR